MLPGIIKRYNRLFVSISEKQLAAVSDLTLSSNPSIPPVKGPAVLLILDGVGIGRHDDYDAFYRARTPILDRLFEQGQCCSLLAHGKAVGLPSDSDLGGSEVGHNIMGAGRIVDQGPKLVDMAFADDSVWVGAWKEVVTDLKRSEGALHLVGLLSDGNIHSNTAHLFRLIERAAGEGISRLYLHILFDGRDVPDHTAGEYSDELEQVLDVYRRLGMDYRIVSAGGRMVSTMDRYNADWSMVERGWNGMVHGEGPRFESVSEGIAFYRSNDTDLSDQYVPAFLVADKAGEPTRIKDGDAVIMFNFRGDRAIELCTAFESGDEFEGFDRGRIPRVTFAGMMLYDGDLGVPRRYLVQPSKTEGCVSEYLAASGVAQFACAETQKFGHVTYFWNGNRSGRFDSSLEEYVEIPSDKCPFEQRPWMKAAETADVIIDAIENGRFGFIRANFAGGDMVGHSGRLEPTMIALEAIDLSIGRVVEVVKRAGGCLMITADHGNAEDMVERDKAGHPLLTKDGVPRRRTAHSLNKVPFCIVDYSGRKLRIKTVPDRAGLANIAPTILELLGFRAPAQYADSLLSRE